MHPRANSWPLVLEESFSLGAHQSVAGTRSHEQPDPATIFDQSFVGQLLVRLQHREMVDLVFGGHGTRGRQRISFRDGVLEDHRDYSIAQLAVDGLLVAPLGVHLCASSALLASSYR